MPAPADAPTLYLLPTCSTCRRIRETLAAEAEWRLRDIRAEPLGAAELAELARLAGGYEALFSRRARLYRERGLHERDDLSEDDYRDLLLEHYTFLKRPVMRVGERVWAGSAKPVVSAAAAAAAETTG